MFPDADYLVLSSRLIPDLDGGYTLATLARARQMAAAGVHGGLGPQLLTVDPGSPAAHAEHRRTFAERHAVTDAAVLRNLFDEATDAAGAAPWLRAAAHPGEADPGLDYRVVPGADDGPAVGLPVVVGDPDWHTSTAPVVVYAPGGISVGVVDGFGALYRAWLDHVVARLQERHPERVVVLICESRQLGELLADWRHPAVRIIHTLHTTHLQAPYTADAPVNALWRRWFAMADHFDAVLWLTAQQRDEAQARFGFGGVHVVVPHGVPLPDRVPGRAGRVPGRVVMLNRLAAGKRVDLAIRAFAGVTAAIPGATLDVYGEGPERDRLQRLIDENGWGDAVGLRGATTDGGAVLDEAAALLFTSAFEGQGLAVVEALAHGCPVVACDVRYGPRDALAAGGGILVSDGDVAGLTAALVHLLADDDAWDHLAGQAAAASAANTPERAMDAVADVVRRVIAAPARRRPAAS